MATDELAAWITPAGAGKTCSRISAWRGSWDHPRRCGENHRAKVFLPMQEGSPPRMRGKLCSLPDWNAPQGITPADAGKTKKEMLFGGRIRDHPRGCGENVLGLAVADARMRITPADAGKTRLRKILSSLPQDHPRGCGENGILPKSYPRKAGSPPRMRGKPQCLWAFRPDFRITPADAGKTLAKKIEKQGV